MVSFYFEKNLLNFFLFQAPLTIIAVKHCKEIYADLSFTKIDNSTVCAGYINGKIVTCSVRENFNNYNLRVSRCLFFILHILSPRS